MFGDMICKMTKTIVERMCNADETQFMVLFWRSSCSAMATVEKLGVLKLEAKIIKVHFLLYIDQLREDMISRHLMGINKSIKDIQLNLIYIPLKSFLMFSFVTFTA